MKPRESQKDLHEIDETETVNDPASEDVELEVSSEDESAPCCGCCGG